MWGLGRWRGRGRWAWALGVGVGVGCGRGRGRGRGEFGRWRGRGVGVAWRLSVDSVCLVVDVGVGARAHNPKRIHGQTSRPNEHEGISVFSRSENKET